MSERHRVSSVCRFLLALNNIPSCLGLNPQFSGLLRAVAEDDIIPIDDTNSVPVRRGDLVFASFRNAQLNVSNAVSSVLLPVLTVVCSRSISRTPRKLTPIDLPQATKIRVQGSTTASACNYANRCVSPALLIHPKSLIYLVTL